MSKTLITFAAAEDCFLYAGVHNNISLTLSVPLISKNTPVGSVLFKKDYKYDSITGHQGIECGNDGYFSFNYVTKMTNGSLAEDNIFDTNLGGIGIRVSMYVDQAYYGFPTAGFSAPFNIPINLNATDGYGSNWGSGYLHMVVELIKISDVIEPGNMIYNVSDFSDAIGSNVLSLASLNVTANIQSEACGFDLKTPKTLDLGDVKAGALNEPGKTSNEKQIDISLDCDRAANVSLTFSGKQDTDASDNGVIAIDDTSKASGVGVQILKDDMPIVLNEALSVGEFSKGVTTFPVQARIYRTNNTLKPGGLSAITTISITYQ